MAKKILIVAGEASGDLHAANLVNRLKTIDPGISFYGLGGSQMRAAGVDISFDMTGLAVVGFLEILKNYPKFKNIFDDILQKTKVVRPDAAILVDYPGFNLRLAAELKKLKIKVIYFISPQVWAWGAKRIPFIKKNIDLMLVLFKFEEKIFADGEFKVKWCGHPLLDIVKPRIARREFIQKYNLPERGVNIAFLPGSRRKEVLNHLPVMLGAAGHIAAKIKDCRFLVCRAPAVPLGLFENSVKKVKTGFPCHIIDNLTYEAIEAADLAVVASGTATLETAILGKPLIIIYKVSFLTWALARACVKIPDIGLVNVVAAKRVVPELIQFKATPKKIAAEALRLLKDQAALKKMREELTLLKDTLGEPGAYQRAAQEICDLLSLRASSIPKNA